MRTLDTQRCDRILPVFLGPGIGQFCGSHLGTLALKTENFSKKIGRFSKTRKWIFENALFLVFPGFSVQGVVSVNPSSRFTKTTDFFTKILGLRGKGS